MIDENSENLGILDTTKAKALAKERGFDLVEISPNAKPPVCKITEIGSYKYQLMKEQRRKKQGTKKMETKGVRIGVKTGDNDLKFKAKQATKFLDQGHRVKIEMRLKGREKANKAFAVEKFKKFLDEYIEFEIVTDQDIKYAGMGFTTVIRKKQSNG